MDITRQAERIKPLFLFHNTNKDKCLIYAEWQSLRTRLSWIAKTSHNQSFIVPCMSSMVAIKVNILLKTFVVLKRPELNGSLDSDSATTGTSHGFSNTRTRCARLSGRWLRWTLWLVTCYQAWMDVPKRVPVRWLDTFSFWAPCSFIPALETACNYCRSCDGEPMGDGRATAFKAQKVPRKYRPPLNKPMPFVSRFIKTSRFRCWSLSVWRTGCERAARLK